MSQKEFQRVKVIENAVGGKLSVREASRLLQLSERQVQRLKRRYQPDCLGWVQHGNRGRSMPWAVSLPQQQLILSLARGKYQGFNDSHLRENWFVLLIPLVLGVLTWTNGLRVVLSGASSQDGVPVGMTFFLGSVMLLAATGDARMLLGGGVRGAKRIARHLWRMCFGLFNAAGSFFIGSSNRPLRLLSAVGLGQQLSPALFGMTLYLILTLLPLVLLIFWLVRVRFASVYKGLIQLAAASPNLTRYRNRRPAKAT